MDQSFARHHRLTKTDEFSSVFGFRKTLRGKLLTLHYQPRAGASDDARLGLVVGKKFLKRAVDRNRCKRVLREQFRLRRAALPAFDLVARLAAKPGNLDARLLAEEFGALLAGLQRFKPPGETA